MYPRNEKVLKKLQKRSSNSE